MDDHISHPSQSLRQTEDLVALGAGALLLLTGASKRSVLGACLIATSAPLLYRGVTGRWPVFTPNDGNTRRALAGDRGIHVRESCRLAVPVAEVYRAWRKLEQLPRFLSHLESVSETPDGRSHWVAKGPAGTRVEWDAEIINELDNKLLAWRSLPESDVATAGAVTFDELHDGRGTQVNVDLQYAPPAGKVGAAVAWPFGREPSQTIREDLRHLKHWLEAGEVPVATRTA